MNCGRHLVELSVEPRDEARVAQRGREGAAAAALPPAPCAGNPAANNAKERDGCAGQHGNECRHPETSVEAIGGSAGAAAEHMHAATAGVVAAAAEPPAEISRSCRKIAGVGAQPSNPEFGLQKKTRTRGT